jgi:outer membrane protein OmpA-like peptidoglycan-associated protein
MTMKKFFLTVAICAVAAASVNAQVVKGAEAQTLRGPYETNRLFDNVFIGAAGGVNLYQAENDHEIDFTKRLAPAVQGYIGKWITPSVGIRLGYYGIQAKGFNAVPNPYNENPAVAGNQKMNQNYVRGDLMWNISNAIGGYRADRFIDFAPYLGAGVMWNRTNKKILGKYHRDTELGVTAGIYTMFRLAKALDLTLDVNQSFVNQRYDADVRASRKEFIASAALGLAYQFKNREFSRAHAPVDVTPYNNKIKDLNKLLQDANDLNKKLAADLEAEKKKDKGGQTIYVPGETKVVPSPFAVYFPLGKSTLTDAQKNSIKYFVETAMKSNSDRTFEIVGAADSATGSAKTNEKLGQARLDAVLGIIKACGGNYKIADKNLGGTDEFSKTDKTLNRVVVIK